MAASHQLLVIKAVKATLWSRTLNMRRASTDRYVRRIEEAPIPLYGREGAWFEGQQCCRKLVECVDRSGCIETSLC